MANHNPADDVPLPFGWTFGVVRSQLLIEPGIAEFALSKACYGFVASIAEASCDDTASPLCFQIILKLPFNYGASEGEYKQSWAFARLNAFPSNCISRCVSAPQFFSLLSFFRLRLTHISLPNPIGAITVGDAVKVLLSPADSDYKSANLLGWKQTSPQERRAASPHIFFDDGIEMDHEALFRLPLMGCKYLQPRRGRSSQLLFHHDQQRLVAAESLLPPPTGPRGPKPQKGATPRAGPPPAAKAPAKPLKVKTRIAFDQLLDRFGLLKVPLTAPSSLLRSLPPPLSSQSKPLMPHPLATLEHPSLSFPPWESYPFQGP